MAYEDLIAESELLARCAARLDEMAAELGATTAAPPWLATTLTGLAIRCRVGTSDIRSAARALQDHRPGRDSN
ncbi:hypothetical protein [Actinomadura hibisca]|uniref:hypothetical protein n=1 Tax=Actinomadura hibisca TaxID=68565 RepID=UPI00082F10CF|nr:hypothetical protein [Actinomadura hibisca]